MANDVRRLRVQALQEPEAVGRLLGDTDWGRGMGAAHVATAVVGDQSVPTSQSRLGNHRVGRVGDEGSVDEHHRLTSTRPINSVLKGDVVDGYPVHRLTS